KRFSAERRGVLQPCEYTSEIDPVECPKDQHDREQESEVAYTVHDECFLSGICRGFSREPKSDQEIRGETHAFPSNEHQEIVVRQNQRKHKEDEQVQISEVPIESPFVGHVTGGIDVD